jgi:hypothetical protein
VSELTVGPRKNGPDRRHARGRETGERPWKIVIEPAGTVGWAVGPREWAGRKPGWTVQIS